MTKITEIPPEDCMSACCRSVLENLVAPGGWKASPTLGCASWLTGVGFAAWDKGYLTITKAGRRALQERGG